MQKIKNFVAIDFEMANLNRSSICSIGVVIVKNREIVNRFYRLVHPIPNYYNWFSRIHGISEADTCDVSCFPEVWDMVTPQIEGLPLVAHNSIFDEGCLQAVYKVYRMKYPNYTFYCTCRTARKVFRNKLPDFRLNTVSAYCGHELKNPHHALADAEACAMIALKIFE
jgi:DNA polymerase-3 subunit epsilon